MREAGWGGWWELGVGGLRVVVGVCVWCLGGRGRAGDWLWALGIGL